MRRKKAHAMINSIIATHAEALGTDRNADALRNAKSDLHLMIDELFGDFDAAANEAIALTKEADGE